MLIKKKNKRMKVNNINLRIKMTRIKIMTIKTSY